MVLQNNTAKYYSRLSEPTEGKIILDGKSLNQKKKSEHIRT